MIKEQTATFIGHKDYRGSCNDDIRREIISLIDKGVNTFLNGGMGGFDWTCARIVHDLKKKYPQIQSYRVLPYMIHPIKDEYSKYEQMLFDETFLPDSFETVHYKAAIPARNKYLVENSAYAICYVTSHIGGAAKTLELAKKKGLTIVNLGDSQ